MGERQGLMPQALQSGPALLPALLHETQMMPAATGGQSTAALPRYISHRSFQRFQACLHFGAEVAHGYGPADRVLLRISYVIDVGLLAGLGVSAGW